VKHDLEALLFATDTPLTPGRLKQIFPEAGLGDLRAAIEELVADYERQTRAFTIVEFGGGWQLASRPEYVTLIQKLYRGKRFVRLSQAALEVLAVIAYRQPVTRMEIEEIRGVQVSSVLSTLTERNLVTVVGRSESVGNPLLYGTTREFLNHMGLKGLHQLPTLPELEGVINDPDEIRQFAAQLGEELTDEDFETLSIQGDEILLLANDAEEPEAEQDPEAAAGNAEATTVPDDPAEAGAEEPPDSDAAAEETPIHDA
jgi:segregation and condensation protein B